MFRSGDQLDAVIRVLAARGVSLWHACQLLDLGSYFAVGGVPSRSLLEQARLPFTGFATDVSDRSVGVWSKVFVNLSDFGSAFAHGSSSIPNPYGPIVFQVRPEALRRAADAAICLRSAGARDFDRDSESLETAEEVEGLFLYQPSSPFPESTFLRVGEQLRVAFHPRFPEASAAEISLTMDPELIPIDDVIAIWVDPLLFGDGALLDAVTQIAPPQLRVRQRHIHEERLAVLHDISAFLSDQSIPPSLGLLARRAKIRDTTRAWAESVLARDLDWQFQRYARYLREGTLRSLPESAHAKPRQPAADPGVWGSEAAHRT